MRIVEFQHGVWYAIPEEDLPQLIELFARCVPLQKIDHKEYVVEGPRGPVSIEPLEGCVIYTPDVVECETEVDIAA